MVITALLFSNPFNTVTQLFYENPIKVTFSQLKTLTLKKYATSQNLIILWYENLNYINELTKLLIKSKYSNLSFKYVTVKQVNPY